MTTPLVSVCIPTRNGGKFLRRTLESVMSQTHPRIEIIISDDASSDGTRDIVEEFRDDRFVIRFRDEPLGAEGNWNESCAAARGDFIKLLCQDDVLLPECLSRQAGVLEANPGASFTWSPRDVISPRGRRLIRARGFAPDSGTVSLADVAARIVRSGTNPFGEPCAVLMRASCFRSTSGFHGEYLIDLEMWIDLLRLGPAVFLDETLSQFRISQGSWTSVLKREHARQIGELATRLAAEFPALVSGDDLAKGARRASSLQRRRSVLLAAVRAAGL